MRIKVSKRIMSVLLTAILVLGCFVSPSFQSFVFAEEDNLIAYWDFNEASGTIAVDQKGNYDGTINGATYVDGKSGTGLYFNGVDNYISINQADITSPWTASFWVNRSQNELDSVALLTSDSYGLKIDQYNRTNQAGVTEYGKVDHIFNYSAPYDEWVNVVFVGTENEVQLYANGSLVGSLECSIQCPMSRIGSHVDCGYFKGIIDEVRIYNKALTPEEIAEIGGFQLPDEEILNDTDSNMSYNGEWTHATNRSFGDYKQDVHCTQINGDYMTFNFEGTGIDFFTEKYIDMGNIDIYIDDVLQETVNCVNTVRLAQKTVFRKLGLSEGNHTIKIVKRSGEWALIDGFKVYRNNYEPEPLPTDEKTLSNGNRILIDKGIQVQSWIQTDEPYKGVLYRSPTAEEWISSNFTAPTYYNPPLYNDVLHGNLPSDAQWSIAKGPYGEHLNNSYPTNQNDFLTQEQLQNVDNLVTICFGDEEGYSSSLVNSLKEWYALSHKLYPDAIVHNNQWGGQWNKSQYLNYMNTAKPDMITIDAYYYHENSTDRGGSNLGLYNTLQKIREVAQLGNDGTGNSPIPFGQYIQGYKTGSSGAATGSFVISESQVNSVAFGTLVMGGKWLNVFRWEYNPDVFLFWDEEGLTPKFYEFANMSREVRNLGPHLVRLNTTDVRFIPGKYKGSLGSVKDNPTPNNMTHFSSNADQYITDITVENTGTQNDGLKGDVLVGYFETLPEQDMSFFANENPDYFMLFNGLATNDGNSVETRQKLTVTFDFSNGTQRALKKVSREDGSIEDIELTQVSDHVYSVEIYIDGGKGDLFFWN